MGTGLFGGTAYTGSPEGDPNPPMGGDDNDRNQLEEELQEVGQEQPYQVCQTQPLEELRRVQQ